jgi:hypothetical protein
MANQKNSYVKKAKKKHFLAQMNEGLPTKGNPKNTVLETGKDVLVGVLGGGLIGAVIGKPSILVGLVTTGLGHYTENKLVQILGIGMMAANGFQKTGTTVSGLEGLDGVKERLQAYKQSMREKFYLDKIMKKKAATTNGFGELQYFTYPDTMNGSLAALDDIEQQIADSAMQFNGGLKGDDDEGFQVGDVELEERMY